MLEGSCHCGAVRWKFEITPKSVTACNCTICRRYGALWAYDYDGDRTQVSGPARVYVWGERGIGFHFCEHCGCIAYYRALRPDAQGRNRTAVNLRMAEPDAVANIPVNHFDGLKDWTDLGPDGRCVADMWF
jgi:hypothetical protein